MTEKISTASEPNPRGKPEDWSLYTKYIAGDVDSFHELFQKYKPLIVNLAYRFVRNLTIAEDIAQETLIKVYEKKARTDSKAKFSTWIYRVTVNTSMDYWRAKKRQGHSLDESFFGDGSESFLENTADTKSLSASQNLEKKETRDLLHRAISALPDKLKSCLLLYQFDQMTYQEIAKILQITPKAVERRLYHAKQILKEKLCNLL